MLLLCLEQGAWQVDPNSAYLFILGFEILLLILKMNPK